MLGIMVAHRDVLVLQIAGNFPDVMTHTHAAIQVLAGWGFHEPIGWHLLLGESYAY